MNVKFKFCIYFMFLVVISQLIGSQKTKERENLKSDKYVDISIIRVLNSSPEMNGMKVRVGGFLGLRDGGGMCLAVSNDWHQVRGNFVDKILIQGLQIERLQRQSPSWFFVSRRTSLQFIEHVVGFARRHVVWM